MRQLYPLGIYIHIPFCLSKCPYCDFYSLRFDEELADRYLASLLRTLDHLPEGIPSSGGPADTVYFGGGTPVLLGERLITVLRKLEERFRLTEDCEVTLEANPAAMTFQQLRVLRENGFNRLSMGVQASNDKELRGLGRLHSFSQAVESVDLALEAGFSNLSVDLMLGTPGQTTASIDRFAEIFCPKAAHISGYLLQVEEGTPFARKRVEELCPGEDAAAEIYLHTVAALERYGFRQYEVSNFAKPGKESRHNLKYWRCGEYLGIGPAAHSFWGGSRYSFPRDFDGFCGAEDPWTLLRRDGPGGDFFEYAMLRLRLAEGLDFAAAEAWDPEGKLPGLIRRAEPLSRHGLVKLTGEGLALTPEGFLLSNSVIGELLEDC